MGPETASIGNMNLGYSQTMSLPSLQNAIQCANVTILKPKPAVPKKPEKLLVENETNRTVHVKDMVRRLQEKTSCKGIDRKENFSKMGVKASKSLPVTAKEKVDVDTSNQTLEDLKAIDEDIEKLRKQIEERDKIISALREAAEAKDKKLENLMVEYSKLRSDKKLDVDVISESSNRVAISSPSSPPLCNEELCWTDNFVNKNYHEPVYAQLLNDHNALQKIHKELQAKLESKEREFERLEEETLAEQNGGKTSSHENAINLIMAEQIRVLKEREAQLEAEAEELREQRDLMEFRILELEECRKEFLDKEVINEDKHRRDKIVWTERDIEDISDSGVMSLPTSEDLTSDSELGDAIRNYSPLGAATNLTLPSSDNSISEPDIKVKKSLKSHECCLQESGIFEDSELPSESAIIHTKQSRGCQTESILDKTLLDFIDSSCDVLLKRNRICSNAETLDDLSTEISKLSVIQKRIQQKTSSHPVPRGPHTVFTCPHTNSVLFYEERLTQLEDKLRIYESSGDTKEILLAKRLQKEVELACKVKELTERVATLEVTNRRLEEEKCEFEEAENDTRFQCQRLEIRLKEVLDKNKELELELERQRIIMNEIKHKEKKKGSLESLISRYEQRNFELEEREVEAKQRLSMIEAAMPAIIAWNVFRTIHNPDYINYFSGMNNQSSEDKKTREQDMAMFQKLEELLDDQKKLRRDYEKVEESAADRERALRAKIEELEAKAAKDREILEEMTNSLKALKTEEKTESAITSNLLRPDEVDLFEELKQMVANEIQLRAEIERLEEKERAYMNSLEMADEIWARMEADYKKRLSEAESASEELQKRVAQLEATQAELEKALEEKSGEKVDVAAAKNEVKSKIEELLQENENLKTEFTRKLDRKFEEHKRFLEEENVSLKDELKKLKFDFIKEEKKYILLQKELEFAKGEVLREKEIAESLRKEVDEKNKSVTAMEISLQNQISELNHELSLKGKELSNLEVTVAELREEVETLENKVAELVETIQTTISNQEEDSASGSINVVPSTMSAIKEPARHVVSLNLKPPTKTLKGAKAEPNREVVVKEANDVPSVEVLMPSKYFIRCLVFAATYLPRQDMKVLFPHPSPIRKMQMKFIQSPPTVVLWIRNSVPMDESSESPKDDEIFQLCVKNTELQQTVEKMEEEARLKEKELEELQKIALEIRNEQLNLELLYEGKNRKIEASLTAAESSSPKMTDSNGEVCDEIVVIEDPNRTESFDVMQIISPAVVKTSDHTSTHISNIQIAFDKLKHKSRAKNFVIKSLLEELQQRGDTLDHDELVHRLSLQYPGIDVKNLLIDDDDDDEDADVNSISLPVEGNSVKSDSNVKAVTFYRNPRPLAPNFLGRSTSACYSTLPFPGFPKDFGRKTSLDVDPDFSYVAPIRTMRKVGDDGIFLEWDITRNPDNVMGYEILVNGTPSHRVRSSSRNKALLHSLNLSEKILIQVYATSERGRSIKCSQITYPDGHTVYRTESL